MSKLSAEEIKDFCDTSGIDINKCLNDARTINEKIKQCAALSQSEKFRLTAIIRAAEEIAKKGKYYAPTN